MKLQVFCSIIITLFTLSASAQHQVQGSVADESNNPLTGATVMLVEPVDSTMVSFAIADSKGNFRLDDISKGSYILQITFLSFESLFHHFSVTEEDKKIDLGVLNLKSTYEILQEVTIQAEHIPMGLIGDTISYNAAAFKVQQGATVEDLLKRLPGVEVQRDGSIKAMGEDVENVLVDGRAFFGDDPKIATQNLEAEAVDKVQVYDKKSEIAEFTGIDDGEEEKTINLQLKEEFKKGGFGNIELSGGSSSRYQTKLNYNRFSPQMQVAAIISANNINQQSFTFSEYIQFMGGLGNALSSGMSMSSIGGFGGMRGQSPQGLNKDISSGLNFNYDISKKFKLTSYFLHLKTGRNIEKETTSNQFSESTDFLTESDGTSDRTNYNNRLNAKLEFKPTPFTHLVWKNSFNQIEGELSSFNETFFEQGKVATGSTSSDLFRTTNQLGYDGNLQLRQKFNKKGRNWINTLTYQTGTFEEDIDIRNEYLFSTNLTTLFQEQRYNYRKEVGELSTAYTEPLGKQFYLGFDYTLNLDKEQPSKEFYDIIDETSGRRELVLNDFLSNDYRKTNTLHRAALSLKKNSRKLKSNFRLGMQRTSILGNIEKGSQRIENNSNFILPSADFEYDITSDQTIRFAYSTSINLPTLNQLAPLPDNSDPNLVIGGNPDLSPEYVQRIDLGFHLIDQFNFKNFFFNANFEKINNRIINEVTIDENLLTSIQPINSSRFARISGFSSYGAPIRPLKLKFDISTQYQWSTYESSINSLASDVTESNLFLRFRLENRVKDRVDIASGLRLDYSTRSYTINPAFDQKFFNTRLFLDGIFYPGKDWTITAKYDYVSYSAEFFSESQRFHLVTASVKKSFNNNKWSISLQMNDLLNQNTGIERSGDINSLYEVRYNTLARYFLIGLQYKLGKRTKKEGLLFE